MEGPERKICRLCLNFEDDNFTTLDASAIGKVKAIIPEMVLSFPNDSVICSKCRNILEKSFELKRTISKNNDLIQNEKSKSKSEKVDLNTIVKGGNPNSIENICRICLKRNEGKYIPINKESNNEFNTVLEYCVPELNINLTSKPAVCSLCQSLLYEMYNYKKDWLSAEEKIQSCPNCITTKGIDLNKVLMLNGTEEENDFLSGFEVQDEAGTDIFDDIPNPTEEKFVIGKRSISELIQEEEEELSQTKKQKLMTGEITDEELPYFHFDTNLLYNPNKTDIMVEDWLARVEEYKQKFNWSDYTTIHKVLVKLKDMKELYIWFSNIADIMDWEQWKKKLIRAFPRKTDYHIHLKKMILRRKRREETYVNYYNDKIKLMEPMVLTAEQKVSCIFGGITDVLVCCVGRVGDYKNPEELLDYFKSCDDKQTIEAAADMNKEVKFVGKTEKFKQKFQSQSDTKTIPGEKKKDRKQCYECHRYGHTVIECRQYKIAMHLDKVDQIKVQNNPKMNESKAKRLPKKVVKLKPTCFTCGKVGHQANVCRLNKKLNATWVAPQIQPPKKQEYAIESCSKCHQTGHTMANCFNEWLKHTEKRKNTNSTRTRRHSKNIENKWVRCNYCGKRGNKANPCCSAKMEHNETYVDPYSGESIDFNKQICLRCYKPGHLTNDCEEFARRSFRN